jgi:Domain of unknown function (DUF4190)
MTNYDPNQGAPGAPYASYPPPPPSYPPQPPAAGGRTNGLAVASLVLGIVWLCGVGSILALVFGAMALSRIKRTGEGGRGLAIAGIVLGSIGAVMLVISVAAIAGSGGDDDSDTSTGTTEAGQTTEDGPETDSNNEENPPPEDINDDTSCTTEAGLGPVARGTLTNHSSGLSGYLISVGFLDAAGTRVAEGTAIVNNVQAGQTANWEAPAFDPSVQFETCEVVSVERLAQ